MSSRYVDEEHRATRRKRRVSHDHEHPHNHKADDAERYAPIEQYGIIGDLRTAALVRITGDIDFCCLPHFDSPTVFARLLDADRGGFFSITPRLKDPRHKQMYLPDTNVLLTRFLDDAGVVEISAFMTIGAREEPTRIVRRVKAVRGEADVSLRCAPRFDYGRVTPEITIGTNEALMTWEEGQYVLRLAGPVEFQRDGNDVIAEFHVDNGDTVPIVLEALVSGQRGAEVNQKTVSKWFKETVNYWREWMGETSYKGRWRDTVYRSALVLKLLQARESGSVVAAPTFGLPESIGGERNWDYRYTWVRDASFTFYSLIRLGLVHETKSFIEWLSEIAARTPHPSQLQTVYGIDGRTDLPERTLEHFEGYRQSRPVRIGNAAYEQLQLDIYGELMDAIYLYDKYGEPTSHKLWSWVTQLVDWVVENWNQPDEGLWEVRKGPQEFLYSRVLCWVAIDRGLRLATKRSFPAPVERWREARDEIYNDVFTNFWDDEEKTFVGIKGSKSLDASCLIMPLVRFIAPTDPKWIATMRAIERRLQEDSLIYRYDIEGPQTDGLRGTEGTFSICSFWYVECLSRSGDLQKARFYFEKLLGYANHLGLFAEEIGPKGEHLGNFPQALTHLGLISAALRLIAALTRDRWLNACGKFPSCSPVSPISSEKRPR